MKMYSPYRFIFMQIELIFIWKVSAEGLVLKPRHKPVTQKWPTLTPACKINRHIVTHVAALFKAAGIVLERGKRRKFRETKVVLHLSDGFSASVFSARHPDLVAPRSCSSSMQFLRIKNQIWSNWFGQKVGQSSNTNSLLNILVVLVLLVAPLKCFLLTCQSKWKM